MPFTFTTVHFQTLMRAGVMSLLAEYANGAGLKAQLYPARPNPMMVPSFFPDQQPEDVAFTGPKLRQRTISTSLMCVWGLFDTKEAVTQRDAFVDGFTDYVTDNRGKIHPNSVISALHIEDIPDFVPTWIPSNQQLAYFASRITLEGYVEG